MTNHSEEYKTRVVSFQKAILILQLFLMVIGGCIFGLGVITRPILRITKQEFVPMMRWIVNVMVGAGLCQIIAAAYDIFCGCWKLIWPIYLGIGVTGLATLLEITAIVSSLYLYGRSESMVNEDIVHPWYWVECLNFSSCHDTMLRYIHYFILPQVLMAALTVLLQCLGILLMSRFVRAIADHFRVLHEAQEKYHEQYEESKWDDLENKETKEKNEDEDEDDDVSHASNNNDEEVPAQGPSKGILKTPRVHFSPEVSRTLSGRRNARASADEFEMSTTQTSTYNVQIHATVECPTPTTPCSYLQTDHGYVAGSRVSLDFDKM